MIRKLPWTAATCDRVWSDGIARIAQLATKNYSKPCGVDTGFGGLTNADKRSALILLPSGRGWKHALGLRRSEIHSVVRQARWLGQHDGDAPSRETLLRPHDAAPRG